VKQLYGLLIYIIAVTTVVSFILLNMMNDYIKKIKNPIPLALIIAAIGLGSSALYSANSVENLALNNKAEIKLESILRVVEAKQLAKDLEELQGSIQDIYAKQETDTSEIKSLLYDILRQNLQPREPR